MKQATWAAMILMCGTKVIAAEPALDFNAELSALTKSCLASLEARSKTPQDLTSLGYTKRGRSKFVKKGKRIKLKAFSSLRPSIIFTYDQETSNTAKGRYTVNRCVIIVEGLPGAGPIEEALVSEQKVVNAVRKAASSKGYKGSAGATQFGKISPFLTKGKTKVTVSAYAQISSSARRLNIRFRAPQ